MTDDLIRQRQKIELADKAIAFLESPLGKHLAHRAEAEERAALEALATVDPEDSARIRALQNDVWRAQSVLQWLGEAINEGVAAQQDIGEREVLPESSIPDGGTPA